MDETMKTCPYCGEEILAVAKKCKHCGEWLNNDEEQKEEIVKVPCPICGEMIEEGATQCPHCNESIASEVMQKPVNEEASESAPPNKLAVSLTIILSSHLLSIFPSSKEE